MSFELQKIVNQLEIVSKSLQTMDRELSLQESTLDRLYSTEEIETLMGTMMDTGLLQKEVYSSAWQAYQGGAVAKPIQSGLKIPSDDEDELEKFLIEEEIKKTQFRARLQGTELEFKQE